MNRMRWMFVCASLMFLLTACHHKKDNTKVRDTSVARTILVYMVAENSLYQYVRADISEMLAAKSSLTDNDRLVIFLDNEEKARIFVVTNKTSATNYSELKPAYTFENDPNSSSPVVLKEVLSYVKKNCPADVYGFVGWSHASGWISSTYEGVQRSAARRRSFGVDNGQNTLSDSGHQMNIDDMAEVFADFPQFEFILFDACFMQCAEVAYELRHATKYLIGSPAEIPGEGAPYHKIVPLMFDDTKSAADITKAYFDYYASSSWGSLMSVVDCSQMDEFVQETRRMIERHRDELLHGTYDGCLNYYQYDLAPSRSRYPDFYDVQGIMQLVLTEDEYDEWKAALDLCVKGYYTNFWYSNFPHNNTIWHIDEAQYSGLTLFVPQEKYDGNTYDFNNDFQYTNWAKDVWGNL